MIGANMRIVTLYEKNNGYPPSSKEEEEAYYERQGYTQGELDKYHTLSTTLVHQFDVLIGELNYSHIPMTHEARLETLTEIFTDDRKATRFLGIIDQLIATGVINVSI